MMTWFNAIILGMKLFVLLTLGITFPIELSRICLNNSFNPVKFITDKAFHFYLMCLIAVVFFPLPTASQAVGLTYKVQLIPFFALYDIITNFSISAVCQVIFNIIMTVPFGMFLRYRFGFSARKTVIATLILSAFIEIAQLTGLFFIYKGSFRLCDVDDLMLNTLGGFIGSVIYSQINNRLPSLTSHVWSWKDGILVNA